MPINAHPEYLAAEKEYLKAYALEDKIEKLKKMISLAPSHKGAENLRKQLKTRLKKLQSELIKAKKSGKRTKGIKKEDMQGVIIGFANSGKSSLLSELTNAKPKINKIKFSTKEPIIGMMTFAETNIQLIENPAIGSEYYDKGLTNSADTILLLVNKLKQIKEIENKIQKSPGKKIIVFNKIEPFSENQRKIQATLQSKRYDFVIISTITKENIEELKEKLFKSFDKIRVHTKEPGKEPTTKPVIMNPNSTVQNVAEKILKGFAKKVKQTRIWGPSSKFPGQKVGLKHKLKDKDIIEFKTN